MEHEKYREWMTSSHYEALPAEAAAELSAHLLAHPDEKGFADEVARVADLLSRWRDVEAPLDADAVLAAAHPAPAVVAPLQRARAAKGWSWRRGIAVAASFAVGILAWTQGIAVEVDGHRFAFNAPALSDARVDVAALAAELRPLVLNDVKPMLASEVNAQINPKMNQLVADVNEVFSGYQTGIDRAFAGLREETNERLRQVANRYPTLTMLAAPPLDGGNIDIQNVRFDQPLERR